MRCEGSRRQSFDRSNPLLCRTFESLVRPNERPSNVDRHKTASKHLAGPIRILAISNLLHSRIRGSLLLDLPKSNAGHSRQVEMIDRRPITRMALLENGSADFVGNRPGCCCACRRRTWRNARVLRFEGTRAFERGRDGGRVGGEGRDSCPLHASTRHCSRSSHCFKFFQFFFGCDFRRELEANRMAKAV